MINPAFKEMDDFEIRQVLNSFIIHNGQLVIGYRPDHNYSSYAPKIIEDMYPSIFLLYRNEAEKRGIMPSEIRTIKDGSWINMIEGVYAAYQRDDHIVINFGEDRDIRIDHIVDGVPQVLYL